jgi:hypothetical protein
MAEDGATVSVAKLVGDYRARKKVPGYLTLREAVLIAGSLGVPSKMPGYSYGLDAKRCHTGSRMAQVPGSICKGCFALKNFYATWKPALIARKRRHEGIVRPQWVDAMVRLIDHYCVPPDNDYFRWHDSGDLQGVWHLAKICAVAARTPNVKQWLPTREYGYVERFLKGGGVIPDNLTIRLSALMIDSEPVVPAAIAHLPTSTVHTAGAGTGKIMEGKGSIECRAIELRDNQCGDCRACWSRSVSSVSYPQH